MSCYWLIVVPNEKKTQKQTFEALASKTAARGLSDNYAFDIPNNLKVGTLDNLMNMGDELVKVDTAIEHIVSRIERVLSDLQDKSSEPILFVNEMTPQKFTESFRWDQARYSINDDLKTISNKISEACTRTDEDLKVKLNKFNDVKNQLATIERRDTGSLMLRALDPFVKKADIIEGEYISTLMVVVPRAAEKDWLATYEILEDLAPTHEEKKEERPSSKPTIKTVVPRSAKELSRDDDFILYRVVVFKKGAEAWKNLAREKRFAVRPFTFDPEENKSTADKKTQLEQQKQQQWGHLIRWCKNAYSETFAAWIHIKAVRSFVEAVLRYGLPVDFAPILLKLKKGQDRSLRKTLDEAYAHLGDAAFLGGDDTDAGDLGAGHEMFSYVFLSIELPDLSAQK